MRRRDFLKTAGILGTGAWFQGTLAGPAETATDPLRRFKLGSISDEWSQDFEAALKAMKSYDLDWVEIRTLWNTYSTETTPEQTKRIRDLLDQYHFKVSVIDTAVFKCALPGTSPVVNGKDAYAYSEQIDVLKRAMERAHTFGTDKLRLFAFWRVAKPEDEYERIAENLGRAAELAASNSIRLVLENENACNVATGRELARMLQLVPADHLGANWDVGNGYWEGEVSFPDGYAQIPHHRIWHMHLKDVRCDAIASGRQKSEAWKLKEQNSEAAKCHTTIVGAGQINLLGQMKAMLRDNYQGTMSLEPEYDAPGITHLQGTQRSLEALLKTMRKALE